MNFTDEDLMMLEQLTYIDGAPQVPGETVGQRLAVFNEEKLLELEKSEEGQQQAAIIRYIQSRPDMCGLRQGEQFKDEHGTTLATAYYYDKDGAKDTSTSLVTFHGTATPEHWFDNATGLGTSDTEAQKAALEYINSLPYDDITVVGHSKGGNLSQYVTILSDKVNRCVSMDGQGFSQEFIDKYWGEINLKGDKIVNYSLTTDYVHILLYPIPNSKQDYCAGDRIAEPIQHHFANSFFHYYTTTDENGNSITVIDTRNGQPVVYNNQTENEMMTYLHRFTCFVLATMPVNEREKMGIYIGNILKLGITGQPVNGYDNVWDYIMSDEEMLSKVIAYLIKYMELYNPSEEELRALMSMLGLTDFVEAIDEYYEENKTACNILIGTSESLLSFLLKQLGDGKDDKIIEALLDGVEKYLSKKKGIKFPIGLKETWKNVENEYVSIPKPNKNANQNIGIRQEKEYDYSVEVYHALIDTYNQFAQVGSEELSQWNGYSMQNWYSKLFINTFVAGINRYNWKLENIVTEARSKTEKTFDMMADVDRLFAKEIAQQIADLNILILSTR